MKNVTMKTLMIILTFFSIFSFAETEQSGKDNKDLTQFDYPFMIGKWNILTRESGLPPTVSVVMNFNSDYTYQIIINNTGQLSINEKGTYSIKNNSEITLLNGTEKNQTYKLQMTQNKMLMNEMLFVKEIPLGLSGHWDSIIVENEVNHLENVNLLMTENFLFKMNVSSSNGKEKVSEGVYIVDNGNIMFMTKEGENIGYYTIEDDILKLNLENGELYSELVRVNDLALKNKDSKIQVF